MSRSRVRTFFHESSKMTNDIISLYKTRLKTFTSSIARLKRRSSALSNLRLLAFAAAFGGVIFILYYKRPEALPLLFTISSFIFFIALIITHSRVSENMKFLIAIAEVNRKGIDRQENRWQSFEEKGEGFLNPEHFYTGDLDILGTGSLYQYICVAHTFLGRKKLAAMLSENTPDTEDISGNQEAIRELSSLLEWRQTFEARSVLEKGYGENPEPLLQWMKPDQVSLSLLKFRWLLLALPFASIALSFLLYMLFSIPALVFLFIPINVLTYFSFSGRISRDLNRFDKYEKTIQMYAVLLDMIERQAFHSPKLNEICKEIKGGSHVKSSSALESLYRRITFSQIRYNGLVAFALNLFFLWDIQSLLSLYSWRRRHGLQFQKWISIIAHFEALSSLSILHFENPEWVFPEISAEINGFTAENLGHPLISGSARIANDISIPNRKTVTIITGSNMSGKTTFLRTVGVNLVLAYAGAPVCASRFRSAPFKLYSSMRISDNLQEGISTFYSELLKIKRILETASKDESLVLIDEIFRGTNSRDRHTAAVIVLEKLLDKNALTLISTHDYDLTDLGKEAPKVYYNYHFRDSYTEKGISFDYKLQPGASEQSNALALVKLAGIWVEK